MSEKNTQTPAPEFAIQRIYIKDLSFESPVTPEIFKQKWDPEVNYELSAQSVVLGEDHYEVMLKVMVTVKNLDKTVFLVELQQGGIFLAKHVPADQMGVLLGSFCPNILYPYAREAISDVVVKGGFPQLLLAPVNFDAIYAENLAAQQKSATSQVAAATTESEETV